MTSVSGVKRRLAEADEQEQVSTPGASSSSGVPEDFMPPRRGGIRQ